MPRRSKVLFGVLFALLSVLAVVGSYRWYTWRQHQSHWEAIMERAGQFAQANRPYAPQPGGDNPIDAPAAEIVPGPIARFEPIDLVWKESDWSGELLSSVDGCLPIAPDTDLVWNRGRLFLMRERGRLEHVWSAPELSSFGKTTANDPRVGPCFDGRYVWLVLRNYYSRSLMVVDPTTKEAWEFGSDASGLFSRGAAAATMPGRNPFGMAMPGTAPAALKLAPVRPGVVCGVFGDQNAWVALLEFDPQDNKREVVELDVPNALVVGTDNTTQRLFGLDADVAGQPAHRIVLSRQALPLLVIDPETRQLTSAHPTSAQLRFWTPWCLHDGAIWSYRTVSVDANSRTLTRTALPTLEEQPVLSHLPDGLLGSDGQRLLLFGEECWQVDDREHRLQRLNVDCFWTYLNDTPQQMTGPQMMAMPAREVKAPTFDDLFAVPTAVRSAPGRTWRRPVRLLRSAVYGLLLETTAWNHQSAQLFSLSIADADGDAQNAVAEAATDEPAATVSRLTLRGAGAGSQTRLALLEAPREPERIGLREQLPVLAREIVRQSLWLAARNAGYAGRDGGLGESLPDDRQPDESLLLSSWFRDDGSAEVSLRPGSGDETLPPVWREQLQLLNDARMLDYPRLVELAEAWSRDEFPKVLASKPANDEQAVVAGETQPDAALERLLGEMNFVSQFAAIQKCSNTQPAGDAREESLGGLVRGYANLGVLTQHHWTSASKTFAARALLYAQRMVAANKQSAAALWHRAYAEVLAGLPGAALGDLAQAEELEKAETDAPVRPSWVETIAAACRYDGDTLVKLGVDAHAGQLAGLLDYLQLCRLQQSVLAARAAKELLERQPECFRVYDAMCDSARVDTLLTSTAQALEACQRRLPERLRSMSGLPSAAAAVVKPEKTDDNAIEHAATALADTPDVQSAGLSWQAFGGLLRETLFQVCWRRIHQICFWMQAEGADDFLKVAAPLVAHHPCRRLFDFYGDGEFLAHAELDQRQTAAATELLANLRLSDVNHTQQRLYEFFFGRGWQAHRPTQYAATIWRPAEHLDGVLSDLLEQLNDLKRLRFLPQQHPLYGDEDTAYYHGSAQWQEFIRQANAVSRGNPEVVGQALRKDTGVARVVYQEIVDRFAKQPHAMWGLSQAILYRDVRGQDALKKYLALSPDPWAYQELAKAYLEAGKLDLWQAMLDDYLAREEDDEAAASVRVEMANLLIGRGEWAKALPYAEQAAKKKSEAAMACVIRCYQGLGEDALEGEWHERIVDCYPGARNSREYYLWSRRTGLGDVERLLSDALVRMGPQQEFAAAGEQVRYAAFYWLARRPDEAIRCYELAASMGDRPSVAAFSALCVALVEEQRGNAAARDAALARVRSTADPDVKQYIDVAKWMASGIAQKKLNRELAEQLSAQAPLAEKPATDYLLGYAFLLTGQTPDAITYLERSATFQAGANASSRTLASAVLRDRGIVPGKLGEAEE